MIINPKNTNMAYRCPVCGMFVRSVVGVFSLTGDMMHLRCPCGESEMTVKRTNDGRFRFSVPCFVCRKNHEYVLSGNVVFSQEHIGMSCHYSGFDIAFAGSKEGLDSAIDRADRELDEILGQMEEGDVFGKSTEEEQNADFSLLPGILLAVKELIADGKIKCDCEAKADRFASRANNENLLLLAGDDYEDNCNGDLSLSVSGRAFVLKCHACEKKLSITEDNVNAVVMSDHLELE